jgi:predicted nucleotidyltransferase
VEEDLIARIRQVVAAGPPLRLAIMFGSLAKGTARTESDLDLAILPRDLDLSLHAELELSVALTRATGREVDLVRLERVSPLLRWEIARTGRVVCGERDDFVRLRRDAAIEHADFADVLARTAATYRRRLAEHSPR